MVKNSGNHYHELSVLQIDKDSLTYLTRFRYKARCGVDAGEHEIDYALIGRRNGEPPRPDPDEVEQCLWVDRKQLQQMLGDWLLTSFPIRTTLVWYNY